MDTIANDDIFQRFLSFLDTVFGTFCNVVFEHKIIIGLIVILITFIYRFAIANVLYVQRRDKQDWIVFFVVEFFAVVNMFVALPGLFTLVEFILLIFMFMHVKLSDKAATVYSVMGSSNITYIDNNSDEEQRERDSKIRRSLSLSNVRKRLFVPVVSTRFRFKVSATVTDEELARVVKKLNEYFYEYDWRKVKTPGGIKYDFICELKSDKNILINFDKEISDDLDWCIVPVGAIDYSTQKRAKDTPYVWEIQDPKTVGKKYKSLAKTKLFYPSPHAFVVGATGGGKSVLINTMIAHWVNKAKTMRQVELYLVDAKFVEFKPYAALEEVKGVAVTLEEAVDLTNEFREEMMKRNRIMSLEGIKSLPLDGKLTLKKTININGHIIPNTEIIEFRTTDGKLHRDRAMYLADRDDIVEVNIPEDKKEEKEEEKNGRGGFGGW